MRYLTLVEVVESLSQSPDYCLAVVFRGSVVGLTLEVVVQRNAIEVLHNDVQVVVGLNHIQYLHHIGVAQHLQDAYLSPY